MTDHYAEANRLIDGLLNLEGHNADFDMALAQVHASLALAEQQRIANLIALMDRGNHGLSNPAINSLMIDPHKGNQARIRPDIARALRIETT